MLVAGVGKRLGSADDRPPKVLLEIGGKSLLRRHIEIVRSVGVAELVLATGYRAELIERELEALGASGFARTCLNPDYETGSVVSLWAAREALMDGADVLLMDGDVLYDRRIIRRLLDSRYANCFLMDRDFEPGDEPVKLCIRAGRIVDFDKQVGDDHEIQGESVGFFRFSAEIAHRLGRAAEADVALGRKERMYEHTLKRVLLADPDAFGYEDITGLPWIEIDFPDDVRRAREEILPRLEEHGP